MSHGRPREIWLPLVDEPIGTIVAQIQQDDPDIERLVGSPHRVLAFRTFVYIRVGIQLGQLLVEEDLQPYDGSETWSSSCCATRATRQASRGRSAPSPRRSRPTRATREDEQLGPDEAARERFREFARRRLETSSPAPG